MERIAKTLLLLKWLHSAIAFFMLGCLIYILYAGVTATFDIALLVAVGTILIEGAAIGLNKWRCPLTTLALKLGDERGSVADLFLPDIIARNLFKYSPWVFAAELLLLGVRYVAR